MANKQGSEPTVEVLKDILAVQLLLAGVPQKDVRAIVRCEMKRITELGKGLNRKKEGRSGR